MNYTPQTTFAGGVHPAGLVIIDREKETQRDKLLRLAHDGITRRAAASLVGITFGRAEKIMDVMVSEGLMVTRMRVNEGTHRPVRLYFRNERVVQ